MLWLDKPKYSNFEKNFIFILKIRTLVKIKFYCEKYCYVCEKYVLYGIFFSVSK